MRNPLLHQSVENFSSLREFAIVPLLFLLLVGSGCSTKVEVSSEKRSPSETTEHVQKSHTKVGVQVLADREETPRPASSPEHPPGKPEGIEIDGSGNFAIIVGGGLHLEETPKAMEKKPRSAWNTKIGLPTQLRGADRWTLSCYLAVWAWIIGLVALMIHMANRKEEGGPLWIILALLAAAVILLQFLPHADSGIQFIPLSPWSYLGWESFFVSFACWAAILSAGYVVADRSPDTPQAFSFLLLIAMGLNGLLSWSAVG